MLPRRAILSYCKVCWKLVWWKRIWGLLAKITFSTSRHCFAPTHFSGIWAIPSLTASRPASYRPKSKRRVIFRKGDIGSKLYAVRAGAVRISAPSEEGKDAIFNLVVPGELFGEIAFLDGGQRTADAVAIDNSELMVIERRDFIPLIQDNPEVAIRLITILCGRLRRTSEQVEDIVFLGLSSRLAKVLLHLYQPSATAVPSKNSGTQREISQMIGVSREA